MHVMRWIAGTALFLTCLLSWHVVPTVWPYVEDLKEVYNCSMHPKKMSDAHG